MGSNSGAFSIVCLSTSVPSQDPLSAMVNEPHRVLWCFIKDDHNAFKVTDIDDVKELIWEKGKYGKLRGTDAKDLVL
jgi:hypothetical protein